MDEALIKRVLPHSVEAEQSVIGSMLMDREAIIAASEIITGADFYQHQYGVMFESMVELFNEGKPVDLVTLQNRLREKDVPPEVSSLDFVRDIMTSVPTSVNVKSYANIVREKAVLRRLIKVNEEIENLCYGGRDKLEDILCGGTLVCLLLVVLLQVGGRLVGVTLTWTEETTRFFFLWMMFLAVAAGFNRAESSRVVILVNMLPRPMQKVCTVLYYVVTLGFFAFMVKYGIDLTMQKFAFNEMATAVAIPMGAIMICVPLCGFLGIIGTIQSFLEYPHKVAIGGDEK